jgi:hypothetical protein
MTMLLWQAAAAGYGFSPAAFGPCIWLDALMSEFETESGGRITQWNDLSGNDNHATAASGSTARPTLGASGVEFDGSTNYLTLPALWPSFTGVTIFVVARSLDATYQRRFLGYNEDGAYLTMRLNDGVNFKFGAFDGGGKYVTSDAVASDSRFVATLRVSPNDAIHGWVNGTAMDGNGTAFGTSGQISATGRIIGANRQAAYHFKGTLFHVSFFPVLEDSEVSIMQRYLANRYGV